LKKPLPEYTQFHKKSQENLEIFYIFSMAAKHVLTATKHVMTAANQGLTGTKHDLRIRNGKNEK
jgi:hypothetical protein